MTIWVRFSHAGKVGFGALDGSTITEYGGDMFSNPQPGERELSLDEVKLITPTEPTKLIGLVNNFHALIEKIGATVPKDPLYFIKSPSSYHPHGEPILRPQGYDGKIIFEGEVGVVIGRTCKCVAANEAAGYIFGYTCINDVTSIELLHKDPSFAQWARCKAADTYGIFGPAIGTDLDPQEIRVITKVDGDERQNYPFTDMVFDVEELVSRLSYDMTLFPGDVIACGTSVGVGSLKPGNVVEVFIDGVGALRNEFTAPVNI